MWEGWGRGEKAMAAPSLDFSVDAASLVRLLQQEVRLVIAQVQSKETAKSKLWAVCLQMLATKGCTTASKNDK